MVLVDKLLPKLKDAGRRVLIFSQVSSTSKPHVVYLGWNFLRFAWINQVTKVICFPGNVISQSPYSSQKALIDH